MRTSILSVMMVLGCGATEPTIESSAEQAVVLEAPDPNALIDLAQCIEIPDPLTVDWIKQRLTFHHGCFDSWAVRVPVECPLGDRIASGSIVLAGDAMAKLPETGLLIRARAATAALLDLATLANGDLVRPRIDVEASAEGLSLAACAAPVTGGGVLGELQMVAELPSLGTTTIAGAATLARIDGVWTADFTFGIAAPHVTGELVGTGIARADNADPCPDAGEVRFAGSIDDASSEVVLSYTGDDHVVIVLPDGAQVGPFVPSSCR